MFTPWVRQPNPPVRLPPSAPTIQVGGHYTMKNCFSVTALSAQNTQDPSAGARRRQEESPADKYHRLPHLAGLENTFIHICRCLVAGVVAEYGDYKGAGRGCKKAPFIGRYSGHPAGPPDPIQKTAYGH